MRNLRKLTAVVVAIALVLTSMATVFAASTTYEFEAQATVLKDLGIWTGNASGDLMLGKELTRAEGAVLVLKTVLGKTEADMEAADVTSIDTFADAAKVPSWAEGWIALAVEAGVVKGSDNKLNAAAPLLGKDLASMFMNALGFSAENDYAKAVELLAAKATITSISAKIPAGDALLRDAATAIVTDALTAKAKDAKETVIVKYVGSDASLKAIAEKAGLIVAAPADLTVESVKALNAKQVEIKFNADMDKDSAQDESNYEIKSNGSVVTLTTDSAILADSKTVVITVDEAGVGKLKNSDNATVTVKKDIKPVTANKLKADYVNDKVAVSDGYIPSVTKVEATGERSLKLTFSEPVYDGGTDLNINTNNFTVKSGTYTYYVSGTPKADNDAYTISLEVGVKLIEGPITVTVNANGVDSADAIRDYAGYKVFKSDVSFDFVKDTSVSVVSVKEAKPGSVTLKFSKPVKGQITLYHSASKVANYGVTVTKADLADEWVFDYAAKFGSDYKIPQGTVKLFLVNSDSANEPVDGYGIKLPEQTLTTEVVVDVTAPVVSSTKLTNNTYFEVTFDEAIDSTEAVKPANYTLKKVSDGKDVPFMTPTLPTTDKKVLRITPVTVFDDNTQYQLVIKSVKDTSGNKTTAEMTYAFTVGDNVNPTVSSSYALNVDGYGKIYLTFSEAMNEAQMVDKSNYAVDKTSSGAFGTLGDDDKVTKISDKRVLIEIKGSITTPIVRIAAISDLAGKKIGGATLYATEGPIAAETVAVKSADLIAKNKIKITFSTELRIFANDEFSLVDSVGAAFTTPVSIAAVESQTTNSDGLTEVVVVLDKDVGTDAKYLNSGIKIKTAATINNTKSVSDTPIGAGVTTSFAVSDKVAPEVLKNIKDSDNNDVANVVSSLGTTAYAKDTPVTITISFSEIIKPESVSSLSFTVAGYNVDTITVAPNSNLVVITAKAAEANTTGKPNVTQVYNITDANGNVFASGTTWVSR